MDFVLDLTIVQAAHAERVRQAERAYLIQEARRGTQGAAKGANWPLRRWRRWRGRPAVSATTRAAARASR